MTHQLLYVKARLHGNPKVFIDRAGISFLIISRKTRSTTNEDNKIIATDDKYNHVVFGSEV